MTWLLGLSLGLGCVLIASPWLWPRSASTDRESSRLGTSLRDRLVGAGLDGVPIAGIVVAGLLLGIVAAGVLLAVTPIVALAVAAFVLGALAPLAAVSWRARRRRRARAAVWPDVVDHLVSGVRSGLALPDAVSALAGTGPVATRAAFAGFESDFRATGSFSDAIDRLKARLADPVADRLLETLRMAREVGGTEVAHVLRDLAAYLRSEQAVRGELEARQSWVMNAARLGVAAPWIVLLILSARPEAAGAYNSPGGFAIIAVGAIVTVVAYRVTVRVGRLPEEARWFA